MLTHQQLTKVRQHKSAIHHFELFTKSRRRRLFPPYSNLLKELFIFNLQQKLHTPMARDYYITFNLSVTQRLRKTDHLKIYVFLFAIRLLLVMKWEWTNAKYDLFINCRFVCIVYDLPYVIFSILLI